MTIEDLIATVVRNTARSSWDDVTGFVYDLEHALLKDDIFDDVEFDRMDDETSMLNVVAIPGSKALTLGTLTSGLRHAWADSVYHELEASSLHWYREGIVMRFVTAIRSKSLRVTGTVVVSGREYERLVAEFDRTRTNLQSPVKSCPSRLPKWAYRKTEG